jgi:parallel beta-helix repeat protein
MKPTLPYLLFITVIAFSHPLSSSWAATYYVSPQGNNGAAGTQAAPWKTLQQAANKAKAGDTVLVGDGAYEGFFTSHDGTEKTPILFRANGSNVVIQSRNAATDDNINIEGTDYIVIDGFIVKNARRGGIRVAESKGVVIRNNRIGPCQTWCIFTAFAVGIQILNNKTFDAVEQHGIYVSNSSGPNDNPVIRGNVTYGNGRSGIQVNGDCYTPDTNGKSDGVITGAVIENNVVYGNTAKGMSLVSMQDSVVRNNLIYANKGGAAGMHLADEPGCGKPSDRNTVVNNTIVELQIAGIRITDNSAENIIFNNILISIRSRAIADEVGGSRVDKESNLLAHSIPSGLFANPDRSDYHLLPESPARDKGKAVYEGKSAPGFDFETTSRPQGGQVDIGAYEQ